MEIFSFSFPFFYSYFCSFSILSYSYFFSSFFLFISASFSFLSSFSFSSYFPSIFYTIQSLTDHVNLLILLYLLPLLHPIVLLLLLLLPLPPPTFSSPFHSHCFSLSLYKIVSDISWKSLPPGDERDSEEEKRRWLCERYYEWYFEWIYESSGH